MRLARNGRQISGDIVVEFELFALDGDVVSAAVVPMKPQTAEPVVCGACNSFCVKPARLLIVG
jgi:hypothetical protein